MRALPLLALLAAIFLIKLAGNPEILAEQGVVGHYTFDSESGSFIDMATVLGGIIVFLFYWFKFNEWAGEGVAPPGYRPRPVRHFTTWLRYLGWNTFYGLFMAGSYAVIVFFPELTYNFLAPYTTAAGNISGPTSAAIDTFLNVLMTEGDTAQGTPVDPAQLAPYAVMLTTVVWAGMRPFSEFEKRFRLSLQEHAAIPRQAKLLTDTFFEEDTNFVPDPEVIKEVMKHLHGHPLTSEDFNDPGENNLWFLYARTVYLNYLLQKYNRRPVFSKLAERYVHEFNDLELKIKNLNELVLQRIAEIQNLVPIKDDKDTARKINTLAPTLKGSERMLQTHIERANDSQIKYFEGQKEKLVDDIKNTSKDIVQLIVCGVLAVGRSSPQRRDLLEAFGIKQGRGTSQLDSILITWIAFGTIGITFLCSAAYYLGVQHLDIENTEILQKFPRDIDNALCWSIMAGLMHLCAIGGGYFLQRTLETNRRRLQVGKRRKLTHSTRVAEGVWSACVGFSLTVYLLGATAALSGSFESLVSTWWWALVPGVTAFFAALYTQLVDQTGLDQDKQVQKSQRSQMTQQGQNLRRLFWMQGIATGTVATLVFFITNEKFIWGKIAAELSIDETLAISYFGIYIAFTTTLLGLALAKFLHMWVSAEKYAGKQEKRKGARRKYLYKMGKWHTDSGEQLVRAIEVSSSGAEIKTTPPLKLESEGSIILSSKEPRPARVIGIREKDPSYCYVKFLDNVV